MLEKYEGMWGWSGECDPSSGTGSWGGMLTFSVGCFQWTRKASGKGFKKGRVQRRIKGSVSESQKVYDKATEFCKVKNIALAEQGE